MASLDFSVEGRSVGSIISCHFKTIISVSDCTEAQVIALDWTALPILYPLEFRGILFDFSWR